MAPLRILYVMSLIYIFKVTNFEMRISEKRCELAKKCASMTFIAVDICRRMRPLRMLYSVIFTTIFEVKPFLHMQRCPRQICLDWHGPTVALFLLTFGIASC